MDKYLWRGIVAIPLAKLAFIYALLIVASVWVLEIGFGYLPCPLCLWQRWPWYGILLACLCARIVPVRIFGRALLLLFAGSAGVSLFHSGVEMGWWAGLDSCTSGDFPLSLERFQESLSQAKPIVRCDQPALLVLGLSLSDGNLIASLSGFVYVLFHLGKKA
ncbi:MAG: disulfide bond formation protein B [Pseudomonadota bacterium]